MGPEIRPLACIHFSQRRFGRSNQLISNSYPGTNCPKRRGNEISLHRSDADDRPLARQASDLVFMLDEGDRHVEVIAADDNRLSRPIDEIKGRLLSEILPTNTGAEIDRRFAPIAALGQSSA